MSKENEVKIEGDIPNGHSILIGKEYLQDKKS